jgi:hypothetical protein
MRTYKPASFNGMIIFKKNNPNFTITNTDEEISELFKDKYIPVLVGDNKIVGFVKNIEFWLDENLIGDILVWDSNNFYPVFKNYEVYVDKDMKITGIACIEYEEKPIEFDCKGYIKN